MLVIKSHEELRLHLNKQPVISPWYTITGQQINDFSAVTLVQPVTAANPGTTVDDTDSAPMAAPAYFAISLIPFFWQQMVTIENLTMQVNYGIEKLEFGETVYAGSEVRCHGALKAIVNLRGITKATFTIQVEIRGQSAPAFTGDIIFLCHFK